MTLFSERFGYTSPKEIIQLESMNNDLRIGLWNAVSLLLNRSNTPLYFYRDYQKFIIKIWIDFFKKPEDTINDSCYDSYTFIRNNFMDFKWFEVYNFLEFLYGNFYENINPFVNFSNKIMERELSAYRFVNGKITRITFKSEISEIEEAVNCPYNSVNSHFKRALNLFSDKKNPDYRNSIKESISAVESMCRIITKDEKATLGDALKILEEHEIALHPSLKSSFNKLYGYTSDEGGIRHSLLEGSNPLFFEDAKFMLVICSSFVNYLKVKLGKIS
jgi:hypothetical protein